jgi:hypothetical protein
MDEIALLRAENARLRASAEQAAWSAAAQALRAGAQGGEAHMLRQQVRLMRASLFWRMTLPLRIAVDLLRGGASAEAVLARRALSVLRRQGLRAAWARVRQYRKAQEQAPARAPTVEPALGAVPPPNTLLAPCVVIIAELTLPQCAKYRVWQKQAHLPGSACPAAWSIGGWNRIACRRPPSPP